LVPGDSTIGPVIGGDVIQATFAGTNTFQPSADLYVLVGNLPIYGIFLLGDHTLNSTDILSPFLLTNNNAPFIFQAFSEPATLNDPIVFQLTDLATLSTDSNNNNCCSRGTGGWNGSVPKTCLVTMSSNLLCITLTHRNNITILVNYSDAPYWPADRIITMRLEVIQPTAFSFNINSDITSRSSSIRI